MTQEKEVFSFRKATSMIKKFHIGSGDIILLKSGTVLANDENMTRIADALGVLGIDAIVAVVADFDDLTVLNEVQMNKLGWVRTQRISKLVKPTNIE